MTLVPLLTVVHTASSGAEPTGDSALTWFLLLAIGALILLAAHRLGQGEGLGLSLATVGGLVGAAVVVIGLGLVVYVVLLVLGNLLGR